MAMSQCPRHLSLRTTGFEADVSFGPNFPRKGNLSPFTYSVLLIKERILEERPGSWNDSLLKEDFLKPTDSHRRYESQE